MIGSGNDFNQPFAAVVTKNMIDVFHAVFAFAFDGDIFDFRGNAQHKRLQIDWAIEGELHELAIRLLVVFAEAHPTETNGRKKEAHLS